MTKTDESDENNENNENNETNDAVSPIAGDLTTQQKQTLKNYSWTSLNDTIDIEGCLEPNKFKQCMFN